MIISVWGNSGSGKSTLAIKLANSFVRLKKNVVLVDANYIAPQTNIWFPTLDIKKDKSLSVLLDNSVESIETVVSKIHTISANLGVIGYAKDFSTAMSPSRQDTATDFLLRIQDVCDVAIIDCSSNMLSDILTFVAIDNMSDERVVAISPDLRGLSWYDSNVKMMEENWNANKLGYIRCFNQVHSTAPVSDIEEAIGTVSYYLPYDTELRRELYNGTLSTEAHRSNAREYTRVVDSLAQTLMQRHSY